MGRGKKKNLNSNNEGKGGGGNFSGKTKLEKTEQKTCGRNLGSKFNRYR